jgi:prolyl oligopeptidase
MRYPPTKRTDQASVIQGITIADPYRWLEESSKEVSDWDRLQAELTDQYLRKWPDHLKLEDRICSLFVTDSSSYCHDREYCSGLPRFSGSFEFQLRVRSGGLLPGLFFRSQAQPGWRLLVDPEDVEPGSFIDWFYPSPDGSYVAFGLSKGGDEQSVLYIIETASAKLLPEVILFTSFCRLAWLPDSSGFYHSAGLVSDVKKAEKHLFFHLLGRVSSEIEPIRFNDVCITPNLSPDGRYLTVNVNWEMPKAKWYKDLHGEKVWKPFLDKIDGAAYGLFWGGRYLALTTDQAPRGRIIAVPPDDPGNRNRWREVVGESLGVMKYFLVAGNYIVINELYNACSQLRIVSLNNKAERTVKLPGIGLIRSRDALDYPTLSTDGTSVYFIYETFTEPGRLYRYELEGNILEPVSSKPAYDLSNITVRQTYYPAKDGVKVPMFLVHRNDLNLKKANPTIIYGYGGWNYVPSPSCLAGNHNLFLPFVEAGGICAYPGIRGGCEFGQNWWFSGRRLNKQTTFNDFYAAAEYLIGKGYTSSDKLAIFGRSNGGLLIAVAIVQRPDLFAVAVAEVPIIDLIRIMQDSFTRSYLPEYGDPEDPEMLSVLLSYSPLHNISNGCNYPAALFISSESEIHSPAWNSRKITAMLQYASISGRPVLFKKFSGGHGPGLSVDQQVERKKAILGFIMQNLGMRMIASK